MTDDVIVGNQVIGDFANALHANGFSAGRLRPWYDVNKRKCFINVNGKAVEYSNLAMNATLRKDEWQEIDSAVLEVAQERLVGVRDLLQAGLLKTLSQGIGATVFQWETVSDFDEAGVSMDAVTDHVGDRPKFKLESMPVPVIHKEFEFNSRQLDASRNRGETLDVTSVRSATRQVTEKQEDMLFNGADSFTFDGGSLYGYTTFPQRNSVTSADGKKWDDPAKTGEEILADVLALITANDNANHFMDSKLYIPRAYDRVLDNDFKADSDKTIRQRLLEIRGIMGIEPADRLTADQVVLVEMNREVVQLVQGMPLTTVQWSENFGFREKFKVMIIQVPNLRADQNGQTGIAHMDLS